MHGNHVNWLFLLIKSPSLVKIWIPRRRKTRSSRVKLSFNSPNKLNFVRDSCGCSRGTLAVTASSPRACYYSCIKGNQAKYEQQLAYLCHWLCVVSASPKQLASSQFIPGDSNSQRNGGWEHYWNQEHGDKPGRKSCSFSFWFDPEQGVHIYVFIQSIGHSLFR